MAVQIFKTLDNGEIICEYVPPSRLQANLKSGWRLTREPESSEDDIIDEDELRAMAKEAGIKNAGNMKIETLREKLSEMLETEE